MELNGIGGGLMLAVAAVLWMVYLIPNWLKRREYLATERNAVRLQQTIRVLSETAEAPAVPRARVAPSAPVRSTTILASGPVAPLPPSVPVRHSAPGAVPIPVAQVRPVTVSLATIRLRRTRAVTALVLLASIVTGVVQLVLMLTTGVAPTAWLVLGLSTIFAVGSFALLGRLAGVERARNAAAAAPAPRVRRTVRMSEPEQSAAPEPKREWTPVQVPKPVYLSKPVVAPSTMEDPAVQVATELERAQRPPEREVAELDRTLAALGIDVDTSGAAPLSDLNAVLARRRAAG